MRKGRLLFFLIVFTFSFTQFTSAGTPIDITGSQCEVVNGDSLKIKQIIVPGYTGTYWATFQWEPEALVFKPIAGGADTAADNVLFLDGIDDRAEAATSIFPNTGMAQSFTVEAWIYPTLYNTVFIATDDAFDLKLVYTPGSVNNGLGISFRLWNNCVNSKSISEYRDVSLNQWNHVAGIFDASAQQFKVSINGVLSPSPGSFTANTFCSSSTQQFTIGGFYNSSISTFSGKIDEVRVSDSIRYSSDFIPPEVLASDAGTKGLWRFGEAAGSTSFIDSSGNGNTLRGINGAQTGTAP